jgi:hypothetical protein
METNFFNNITSLPATVNSEWVIVVKQIEGTLIVSVLYKDESCGDDARKIIPTLNFNGTASKLDECFFPDLHTAFEGTVKVFSNMEHYLKQQEQAKLQSKMEKDKHTKVEKEKTIQEKTKTDKEKKYDNGLKQAAELEAEGKYSEAWMKVPEPADYPEQADFLRRRREELSAHFAPNLFS